MLTLQFFIQRAIQFASALALALCLNQAAASQSWLTIGDSASKQTDHGYLQYIEDPLSTLSFDYIINNTTDFVTYPAESFSEGFSGSTFWLKLPIDISNNMYSDWFLEIGRPILDVIDVVITDEKNNVLLQAELGDSKPFNERFFYYRNIMVPLDFSQHKKQIVYLKIQSESSIQVPIILWEANSFISNTITQQYSYGVYYGIILSLLLYNLFIFVSLRDTNYLAYINYAASVALLHLSLDGLGYQYLWPDSPWAQQIMPPFAAGLMCLFGALFARKFLQTAKYNYTADNLLRLGILLAVVMCICALIFNTLVAMQLGQSLVLFFIASITYAALLSLFQGRRQARFFVAAWIFSITGFSITWGVSVELLPATAFTMNASKIGSALEIILLSLALADRIKVSETARIEAEQFSKRQLEDRADRLSESMRLKSEFLESISHQFRNPMNSILGSVEIARSLHGDQQQAVLNDIKVGADEMLDLVDTVITYNELQSGYRVNLTNLIDIRQLITDAVLHADQQAMNSDLAFNVNIANDVPGSLISDSKCISYALKAILNNAIQYTLRGTITVDASMKALEQKNCLDIVITDTGLGLSPNDVKELQLFLTQPHRPFSPIHRGLGLGLALTRTICNALGGSIHLTSAVGKGTEVRLQFPVQLPSKNDVIQGSEETISLTSPMTGRALVVEDNVVNQRVLQAMLQSLNLTTDLADNGQRALEILKNSDEPYQIIFMDCQMPIMDGFETTRLLRASDMSSRNTPVIATTAITMVDNDELCKAAGMDDYINKPITRDKIEAMVNKWLNQSKRPK